MITLLAHVRLRPDNSKTPPSSQRECSKVKASVPSDPHLIDINRTVIPGFFLKSRCGKQQGSRIRTQTQSRAREPGRLRALWRSWTRHLSKRKKTKAGIRS